MALKVPKVASVILAVGMMALFNVLPAHEQIRKTRQGNQGDEGEIQTIATRSPRQRKKSHVEFLFVIGLEGTGHHALLSILEDSPIRKRLQQLELHPKQTDALSASLFDRKGGSLWHAWCNADKELSDHSSDLTLAMARVVTHLRDMSSKVPATEELTIPVNTLDRSSIFGMVSYPNFRGKCRTLTYPNLDMFYQACDIANVGCKHIYLYRDPVDIVLSTSVKRGYNRDILSAMHLYNSHLSFVLSQLLAHPERTVGCLGVFDQHPEWNLIRDLFGWSKNSQRQFDKHMQSIIEDPTPADPEDRAAVLDMKYRPLLESLVRSHKRVLQVCRENYANHIISSR